MKFCPNCGFYLDGKLKCSCGYDVETGEVDEKIYADYKSKEKSLYDQSYDNMSMMMGINPNVSNEEFLKQQSQPIFNKENDCITLEELAKLILQMDEDKNNRKNDING